MLSWLLSGWFASSDDSSSAENANEITTLRDALDLLKPLTNGLVLVVMNDFSSCLDYCF
jgi:hypothetical protein